MINFNNYCLFYLNLFIFFNHNHLFRPKSTSCNILFYKKIHSTMLQITAKLLLLVFLKRSHIIPINSVQPNINYLNSLRTLHNFNKTLFYQQLNLAHGMYTKRCYSLSYL